MNVPLKEYQKILNKKGYYVDFAITKYSNHATEIVNYADNYDIVFSIGGDGTLNEVIKGNYLRDNRLTICPLPSGTCNDVASMFGYGKNPVDNLNMALDGEIHDIDIGTINDSPFAYVVGMGKLINVCYETRSEDKRKFGYLAYLKGAVYEILDKIKTYKAEVIVDGVKLNGSYSFIMISNSNHIAGIEGFYKEVCLDDGKMEVLLCESNDMIDFVNNFFKLFIGEKTDDIISLKAKEVSIKMLDYPDKKWCIDGEQYDYDGILYNVKVNDKMKVLTPKVKSKKLFKNKV